MWRIAENRLDETRVRVTDLQNTPLALNFTRFLFRMTQWSVVEPSKPMTTQSVWILEILVSIQAVDSPQTEAVAAAEEEEVVDFLFWGIVDLAE